MKPDVHAAREVARCPMVTTPAFALVIATLRRLASSVKPTLYVCRVCPDEGDDHEVSLLSLCCVNGADLDRLIPVLGERVAKKFVLSSVWCEHQHRWSPARKNPM